MAEYDGSVRVDTQLNTEGFEKGAADLNRAVESVAKSIEGTGSRIHEATSDAFRMDGVTTGLTQDVNAAQEAASEIERSVEEAGDHIREATSDAFRADGLSSGLAQEASTAQEAVTGMEQAVTEGAQQARAATESMLQAEDNGLDKQIDGINIALERAQLKAEKARQSLAAFSEQEIPTAEYKQITNEMQKTDAALLRLYERRDMMEDMGVNRSSAQWERLRLQIESTEAKLNDLERTAESMRSNGDAFIDPTTTLRYRELSLAVAEAEQNLATLQARQAEQQTMPPASEEIAVQATEQLSAVDELGARIADAYLGIRASIHDAAEESREASGNTATLTGILANTTNSIGQAVESFGSAAVGFGARIADSVLHPIQALNNIAGTTLVVMRNIGSAAISAAGKLGQFAVQLAKAGAQKVVSGLRSIGSHIKSIGKQSSVSAISANKLVKVFSGFKRMLISRIKRTFISYLFNQITTAVKELAKYDDRFNQSISNMRNRTTELSANTVAAFGTLIRAIEPYITKALEMVSSAITKISALISELRGEDTVIIAKKQTESYADSLKDTADNAKKAEKAQKRLNATLSSYDQLHKLDGKDGTDTAGADTDTSNKDLFQTVPVDRVLNDLPDYGRSIVDRIRASIRAGNWYGVGAAVADGLNSIVSAIKQKITEIQPLAVKWAHDVAMALNGFVASFNAAELGSTIAAGINFVFATLDSFLTSFDFAALGVKIGEGINSLFDDTDWAAIGQTLADAFNGVLDTLWAIVTTVDWADLGTKLGQGIDEFLQDVKWEELGATLGELFRGVLDFIVNVIENIDWIALGGNLIDGLESIPWGEITSKFFELLGAVFAGIVGFLSGIFGDAIRALSDWWNNTAFDEYGNFTLEGFFKGILDKMGDIGQWVVDHIGNPFLDGIKRVFKIGSPSKVMEEQGAYISAGLENGVKDGMSDPASWVGTKASAISDTLRGQWEIVRADTEANFTAMHKTILSILAETQTAILDSADRIREGMQKKWELIKSMTVRAWDSIRSAASSKMTGLRHQLSEQMYGLAADIGRVDFTSIGDNIVHGIHAGILRTWHVVEETMRYNAQMLAEQMRQDLGIASPSKVFAEIGDYTMQGLQQGLANGEKGVLRSVNGIAQDITDSMQAEIPALGFGDITVAEDGILGHLQAVADKLSAVAGAFAAVGSAIASMGSFPVPQFATGTIIPPKTRIDTDRPRRSRGDDDELIKAIYKLIAALDRTDRPQPGGGVVSRVPIEIVTKIERRELARALAEIDISNGRTTNGRR